MSEKIPALVLYHNPRCGKSREALRLLTEHGHKPAVVLYLENPPTVVEIKKLLKKLGLKARELMRMDEDIYTSLSLDNSALSQNALVAAMAAHPILIERPILAAGGRAVIGRPPERVLELLQV